MTTNKVPKGWKRVKLGEVIFFQRGYDLPRKNMKKGNIPVAGSNGIIEYHNRFTTKAPRVTIGRSGNLGVAYLYKTDFWAHNTALFVKDFKGNDVLFVYYLLKNIDFRQFNTGSAVSSLNRNHIHSLDIVIPENIDEQKAIASVLSSLDDKIDLLHRQNKTLEKMAETLFRQWFIEEAKEDWEEKPLKEIYIFEKGFEPGSKNYLEDKIADSIRFIRVGDMLSEPSVYIKKEMAHKTCTKKDLIMSFDGTVGRITFGVEGVYSSGIRKIYSKNPIYDNLGLKYLIFKSKDIQDLIKSHATGTVILHASSSIDFLTFSFPPENEVEEFNKIIAPIFEKILSNKNQIHTLEQLRDTLLPKLMSGEVRVRM